MFQNYDCYSSEVKSFDADAIKKFTHNMIMKYARFSLLKYSFFKFHVYIRKIFLLHP